MTFAGGRDVFTNEKVHVAEFPVNEPSEQLTFQLCSPNGMLFIVKVDNVLFATEGFV